MKNSRFTEMRIVPILKEADTGRPVKELCRTHGISDATCYNWESKCGGMRTSDLKRMREQEEEIADMAMQT